MRNISLFGLMARLARCMLIILLFCLIKTSEDESLPIPYTVMGFVGDVESFKKDYPEFHPLTLDEVENKHGISLLRLNPSDVFTETMREFTSSCGKYTGVETKETSYFDEDSLNTESLTNPVKVDTKQDKSNVFYIWCSGPLHFCKSSQHTDYSDPEMVLSVKKLINTAISAMFTDNKSPSIERPYELKSLTECNYLLLYHGRCKIQDKEYAKVVFISATSSRCYYSAVTDKKETPSIPTPA